MDRSWILIFIYTKDTPYPNEWDYNSPFVEQSAVLKRPFCRYIMRTIIGHMQLVYVIVHTMSAHYYARMPEVSVVMRA